MEKNFTTSKADETTSNNIDFANSNQTFGNNGGIKGNDEDHLKPVADVYCDSVNEKALVSSEQLISNIPDTEPHSTINEDENLQQQNHHLQTIIKNLQTECGQFQSMLQQKDDHITLQKREMDVLEKEKSAIRRELDFARKEKETAVVKYAIAEKNQIDLRTNNDLLSRRIKDFQKEADAKTARLKFITEERDRANRDLRKSIVECEGLKTELSSMETKLKWNQVKIKQDVSAKITMDARITELTHNLNQLNETRQQSLNLVKYEEKETEAQLIMLKHNCEEKDKEILNLQGKIATMKIDFDDISGKYNCILTETEHLRQNCADNAERLANATTIGLEQTERIRELQEQLSESKFLIKQKDEQADVMLKEVEEMRGIDEIYQEQLLELGKIRAREENLLLLMQELTEKSVMLENKLTLSNSKSAAIVLENEKIKEIYEHHKIIVQESLETLRQCQQKHTQEMEAINTLINQTNSNNKSLIDELDNAIGELDANKRKHSQVIKELTRENCILKTKLEEKQPTLVSQREDVVKEPSKKMLIDRIVRLQRALARQTEKIEFLETHCAALINELKSKS